MTELETRTLEDNIAVVDTIRETAMSLPADAVRDPDVPIPVVLDEMSTTVIATREHSEALSQVGVTPAMSDTFEKRVNCLKAAQVVWNAEKAKGRTEANIAMNDEAEEVRDDLVASAGLALRNNPGGLRRLEIIREGDSLPDLIADLQDLAVLITDARPLFEAINMDVDESSAKASRLSKDLQKTLATAEVAKTLSNSKEMRDRIYTLTKESLKEIRLFAAFAFRKDKSNNRRSLFTSAYLRRKNRKYKNRVQAPITGN